MTSPAELRAYSVHLFTAAGAALALTALFAGAQQQWELMFFCLGGAFLVDAVDGTMARRFKVAEVLPRWSGDVLDLVVDFVTYVFVPAYAIAISGLLPEGFGLVAGIVIVVTSALYFADRKMKTADNYFCGFPALWNAAAFYLFLLKLNSWLATAVVAILAVLTFVPFKFVHPFRVARLRGVTGLMVIAWSALAAIALMRNLDPGPWVTGGLVLAAMYFAGVGLTDRSQTFAGRP